MAAERQGGEEVGRPNSSYSCCGFCRNEERRNGEISKEHFFVYMNMLVRNNGGLMLQEGLTTIKLPINEVFQNIVNGITQNSKAFA